MKSDIQVSYEQAIELYMYEGQLVWSRFQSMLVMNTILFGAIGISLSSNKPNEFILIVLSFIGFLLSVILFVATIRGFASNKFWALCAREIEESSKKLKLFKKRNDFRNDLAVIFNFKDPKTKRNTRYRRNQILRIINTEYGLYAIMGAFSLLYICLLFLSITHNTSIIKIK